MTSGTATHHYPPTNAVSEPAQVPQLFCVLEAGCASRPVSRHALDGIDSIKLCRAPLPRAGRSERDSAGRLLVIRLADRRLSSEHASISLRGDKYVFDDLESKNGSRINGVSVRSAPLQDGDVIEIGQTFLTFRARAPLPETEPRDLVISSSQIVAGLGTLHAELSARFSDLARIAESEVSVAILGETGTGKELVARAIHQMSKRDGKFVPVNCGAIPKDLANGILFGHAKGAFTGAIADAVGEIRAADGGTLFLDEIGELPLEQQTALLRVLNDRNVTPIGGTAREVNFRLVVATNRDMREAVSAGRFRDDLWARVLGFETKLPPLRERREDLGLMLGSLLSRFQPPGAPEVTIRGDAVYALLEYEWPQNARELEQCIKSALTLCHDGVVTFADLPERIRTPYADEASAPDADVHLDDEVDELRKKRLIALLEQTEGNVSDAARRLKKHRTQIQRWLKRYGIDPTHYQR